MNTIRTKHPGSALGVEGVFSDVISKHSRIVHQEFSASRIFTQYGRKYEIFVNLKFDDDCHNGHEDFSITGEIMDQHGECVSGGCIHDEIAEHFPKFRNLFQWHLVSTDGPMHYLANAVFLAGDRDCFGQCGIRFGNSPITLQLRKSFAEWLAAHFGAKLEPFRVEHAPDSYPFGPKYGVKVSDMDDTYPPTPIWHECPCDTQEEGEEFCEAFNTLPHRLLTIPTAYSVGKERELDAARQAACWPDATDAELCQPPDLLKAALEARLPKLLAEFKSAMQEIGFCWPGEM